MESGKGDGKGEGQKEQKAGDLSTANSTILSKQWIVVSNGLISVTLHQLFLDIRSVRDSDLGPEVKPFLR